MSIFENQAVKNGALLAGGVLIGGGATYLYMKSKKDAAEQAAVEAFKKLEQEQKKNRRVRGGDVDPD